MSGETNQAIIGLRADGSLVAVDLDGETKSAVEYLERGYTVKRVPVDEALKMAREQWGVKR
jgi:hypothetical protein